jgi:hypothetical protein
VQIHQPEDQLARMFICRRQMALDKGGDAFAQGVAVRGVYPMKKRVNLPAGRCVTAA